MARLRELLKRHGHVLWRLSMLICLLWIALELRWLRQEVPSLPWSFDGSIDEIQKSLSRIANKLDR